MRLNKISLKQAVAMLAATCTLGTCCIAGSVAWAVDSGNTENKVNTANIDDKCGKNGTGDCTSITLHKYEGPASKTDRSDGTVKNITGKNPVAGVVFKVWRLKKKTATGSEDINLSDTKGWEKIKDLEKLVETASEDNKVASAFVNDGKDQKFVKDTEYTCTTGTDGSCKVGKASATGGIVTTLPMGLYYVEETDVSNATVNNNKVSITKRTAPFFVTTPLPNPNASEAKDSWIYDVNVYPKNDTSKNRPNKEVEELNRKDFEVGDNGTTITWKISVPIIKPDNDNSYTKIGFVDKLTNGLAYKEIKSAKIATLDENGQQAKSNNKTVDDVPLKVNDTEYYTVDSTTTTDVVRFTLNSEGLSKALAAYNATVTNNEDANKSKQTATLVVELVTKFKSDAKAADFANVANTFVDDNKTGGNGDDTKNPCTPADIGNKDKPECNKDNTPTDDAHFGTLTVNKYVTQKAKKTEGKKQVDVTLPLNGAKFDLYEITSKVSGGKNVEVTAGDVTKETTFDGSVTTTDGKSTIKTTKPNNGDAVTFNVKKVTHTVGKKDTPTTLTTADSADKTKHGTASVSLFVKDKSSSETKLYCVVETEAPKGYLLDSRPHCIWLAANTTSTANNVTTISIPSGNTLPVENKKATGMDQILAALPMTGARGLVILTLCGIVGLAGTFFYIVLKRRKEQEQA